MTEIRVETDRLILLPMTGELMEDILAGRTTELERQGITIGDGWLDMEVVQYIDIIHSFLPSGYLPDGFYTWVIIDKSTKSIVGDVGFKGPPNEIGVVDIGYGIIPSFRGKHYATEAVCALIDWAAATGAVRRISAECDEGNVASVHVLRAAGLKDVIVDGSTIYWERRL